MNLNFVKQVILEHYKFPKNYGKLKNSTMYEGNAIGCSDHIKLYLRVSDDKFQISFEGQSCSLSKACASILIEKVNGLTYEEIKNIDENLIIDVIGEKMFNSRKKCSSLALNILQSAISDYKERSLVYETKL